MMALSAAVAAHSYTLTNEMLHYDIVYHWGLIWKHAGSATLSIKKIRAQLRCIAISPHYFVGRQGVPRARHSELHHTTFGNAPNRIPEGIA